MDSKTMVPSHWDMDVDFVVIGSSCGGLTAACKAHDLGMSAVVLEKCETFGGGTAFSGGVIWIPCNHHMVEQGLPDSREAALEHIRYTSMGRHEEDVLAAYLDKGPEMLRDVEKITPLRMQAASTLPDYRDELPGGSKGGRLLAPDPINMAQLLLEAEKQYPMLGQIRRAPFPLFSAVPLPTNDPRFYVAGRALIGGLLLGCIQKNIPVMASTPARKLIVQDRRMIGVRAEREGKDFFVKAKKGVLLATGGYEWNADMNRRYLKVSDQVHGITPPGNSGDGHIMGMEAGGSVALMDLSLFMPTIRIPGELVDNEPMYRIFMFNVGQPGNIIVNRDGRRCCNECFYPDIGRAFEAFDSRKSQTANLPMFWIVDQNYRDRIPVGPLPKGSEMAEWLQKGDTIEELAQKLGLPPQNLKETVERFNKFAKEGLDPDFHRGETGYDKRWAFFPKLKPNPVLGPLEKPPFYGVQLHVGTVGNLGGLVTNTNGQVLDAEGDPIAGLYATSNAAAPLATGYAYTSGMTGGKAMIFGWAAAIHAAGATKDEPRVAAKVPKVAPGRPAPAAGPVPAQPARDARPEVVEAARPVGKTVKILNEDGSAVLDLEAVQKTGDRLRMKGRLMGSFDTNMYMDASGLYRFLGMAIRWGTIKFLLLSPIYWYRGRKTRRGA